MSNTSGQEEVWQIGVIGSLLNLLLSFFLSVNRCYAFIGVSFNKLCINRNFKLQNRNVLCRLSVFLLVLYNFFRLVFVPCSGAGFVCLSIDSN